MLLSDRPHELILTGEPIREGFEAENRYRVAGRIERVPKPERRPLKSARRVIDGNEQVDGAHRASHQDFADRTRFGVTGEHMIEIVRERPQEPRVEHEIVGRGRRIAVDGEGETEVGEHRSQ